MSEGYYRYNKSSDSWIENEGDGLLRNKVNKKIIFDFFTGGFWRAESYLDKEFIAVLGPSGTHISEIPGYWISNNIDFGNRHFPKRVGKVALEYRNYDKIFPLYVLPSLLLFYYPTGIEEKIPINGASYQAYAARSLDYKAHPDILGSGPEDYWHGYRVSGRNFDSIRIGVEGIYPPMLVTDFRFKTLRKEALKNG